MRESTYNFHKMKDKAARDKAWQERMAQPNQYNRYDRHLANFETNQMLDAENQRKLEEQKLKNIGAVDVARTTGEGYAEQQRLRNIGQRDVTGMEQGGLADRARMESALGREKMLGEQYLGLRELEQNPLTPKGYSYIPGQREFVSTGMNQEESQGRMSKYAAKTRKDGTGIEYYDTATGKLAYTEPAGGFTPNVPGNTSQSSGGQAPIIKPIERTSTPATTANQRPSFLRDVGGLKSRVGQGIKQSAARTRQRPVTDFDAQSQYRKLLERTY